MESWTVRVAEGNLQGHTFARQGKDDCYLSANTKLVAIDKAVRLSREGLAKRFCNAVIPTMRQRHGENVKLTVTHCVDSTERPVDDKLVVARIETRNFDPKARPAGV
ncbi:hypothetical protein QPK29_033055 [Massilia sp. YIM B02787]|uniref:Uncharacterized protein n=2 Tax=Massilia orientalis TaxID=3050128 RepID=A0ACC7MKZ7_9BURK